MTRIKFLATTKSTEFRLANSSPSKMFSPGLKTLHRMILNTVSFLGQGTPSSNSQWGKTNKNLPSLAPLSVTKIPTHRFLLAFSTQATNQTFSSIPQTMAGLKAAKSMSNIWQSQGSELSKLAGQLFAV